MKVLMVYPEFPDTFWSFKHALWFVNKKVSNPPLGLMTVSSLLPVDWERKLVDTNTHKLKNKDIKWADLVFVSAMDVQRSSVESIISRVKKSGKPIVAGGPLFTEDFEQFEEVDYFVLNEGELTLPMFIKDLLQGNPERVYSTNSYANMQDSPLPDLSLIQMNDYDCMSIQFSRGCPFNCDFCNVTALLGHLPRLKSSQQILAELNQLYTAGWRRNIFFVDDNFIGNKKILKEDILPSLIEWRKGKQGCQFLTEASINLSDDPELMDLLVRAGFNSVFIGVETPEVASLVSCNKNQNINRDLIANIHTIQRAGLQVMAGFIVGFDKDNPSIFTRMVDFIQKSGIVTAMVGLLQAPNRTELFRKLNEQGRIIKEMSGDNTDGTTNIIPIMDPIILQKGYLSILDQIYSRKLYYQRVKTFLREYQLQKSTVTIEWNEIVALFRTMLVMGLNPKESIYYWNLFFWALFKFPEKFPLAITLTVYGYHFRTINAKNRKRLAKGSTPVPSSEGISIPA